MGTLVLTAVPKPAVASDADSPIQVKSAFTTSLKSVITSAAAVATKASSAATAGSTAATAVATAAQQTKDYVLDTLVWQIGNLAIKSMTKSVVNWINSGFEGSPAFVTDLEKNLQNVGDTVAQHFFDELATNLRTNSPFQDKVLDAVRLGYYLHTSKESFYTKNPYTLNTVSADDKAFLKGDFMQGGWNAWFATIINPANNPYGSQRLAEESLGNVVANATGQRVQELNWGKGFLSWRGDCIQYEGGNDTLTSAPVCTRNAAGELSCTPGKTTVVSLDGREKCLKNEIETPGSVVVDQLNTTFGANVNRLVSADEINEIVGALLNQLVSQVLGGGGGGSGSGSGGLRGLSRASAGGGSSYINQATGSTEATTTASVSSSFEATVNDQKNKIATFSSNWTKIGDAADAAKRCTNTGSPTPQEVSDRAGAAKGKAATAIAELDKILAAAEAAKEAPSGEQVSLLLNLSTTYQDLLTSGTLPTADEISESYTQSQDTGGTEPASLFSRMTALSTSSSCTQPVDSTRN